MKRFLVAPDSYKGTLEAAELCDIWSDALLSQIPDAAIDAIPLADGGEGMVDAFLRIMGGSRMTARVTGPFGETMDCFYGMSGDTAIIEMAACAGLPLVEGRRDPLRATTKGVGELILAAEARGAKRVLLGLGGSATNDGGIGMAQALGYRFLDEQGRSLDPFALNLNAIRRVERPRALPRLTVTAACDVDNALCGPCGATRVFGPQKGVTGDLLDLLDQGLDNLRRVLERDLGARIQGLAGAGAAGGLGAGVHAFLGGELKPGIELLLDAADFDRRLAQCDMVFTGEGRIDGQSARGKVPAGVARRAQRAGVSCVALCGAIGPGAQALYQQGVTAIFSSTRGACTFEEIRESCREDAYLLMDAVARLLARMDSKESHL